MHIEPPYSNILCNSTVLCLHAMYSVLPCTYVGRNGSVVYLEEVPLQALPMFQGTYTRSVCSSSIVVISGGFIKFRKGGSVTGAREARPQIFVLPRPLLVMLEVRTEYH